MKYSATLVLITFWFLCSYLPPVFADEGSVSWINPIYAHIDPALIPPKSSSNQTRSTPNICLSYEDVVTLMRDNFVLRNGSFDFVMEWEFLFDEASNILGEAVDKIKTEDDYLRNHMINWGASLSGYDGYVIVGNSATYWTNYEQEQNVNTRVSEILSTILTDGLNDEQKEREIHDWIVKNVEYDQTKNNYSAYAALFLGQTVCQGYSTLTYKMLKEVNIASQIINSDEMDHAWNLVSLCGNWYHLDVTWDDPVGQDVDFIWYNYYNKSDDEIIELEHYWDYSAYPEAPISYEEGVCENWPPPLAGDINKKDGINLQDAILALQVCSGAELPEMVYSDAAINGDVIGIIEAIFALQTVAEIRK